MLPFDAVRLRYCRRRQVTHKYERFSDQIYNFVSYASVVKMDGNFMPELQT
jgi:hypothetical protein